MLFSCSLELWEGEYQPGLWVWRCPAAYTYTTLTLEAVPGVRIERRWLSLVSSDAEVEAEVEAGAEGGDAKGGRELPGSTHLVLIVRQPSPSPRQAAACHFSSKAAARVTSPHRQLMFFINFSLIARSAAQDYTYIWRRRLPRRWTARAPSPRARELLRSSIWRLSRRCRSALVRHLTNRMSSQMWRSSCSMSSQSCC